MGSDGSAEVGGNRSRVRTGTNTVGADGRWDKGDGSLEVSEHQDGR